MTDEPRAPTDFDSRTRVSICIQSQIQIDLESMEWYNKLISWHYSRGNIIKHSIYIYCSKHYHCESAFLALNLLFIAE